MTASQPESDYHSEADAALADFQSGRITFPEWNRRQREACDQYWDSKSKEDANA